MPVMIKSFEDEYDLQAETNHFPAPPKEVLTRTAGDLLDVETASKHRSDTDKLIHMMKWNRHNSESLS
jgi:hypothetical protein